MREIRDILAEFRRRRGEPLALATLVRARGSSYRRPGARMLVASDGARVGCLSGGCLEDEVGQRALDVIATGIPVLINFDTRLRYGCNGSVEIFVEKVEANLLEQLAEAQIVRRPCLLATSFENGESLGTRVLVTPRESSAHVLVQEIAPPLQLLLMGNGPESPLLRGMASLLGWSVLECEEARELPGLDEWTAAIVKTHNFGRDFAALTKLLPLGLRYVGLLGPRRRRDELLHALIGAAVAIRSELFAPAGLDLGAEYPEQIALAMVTEIQAVFTGATGESLRDRKAAIHLLRDLAVA